MTLAKAFPTKTSLRPNFIPQGCSGGWGNTYDPESGALTSPLEGPDSPSASSFPEDSLDP